MKTKILNLVSIALLVVLGGVWGCQGVTKITRPAASTGSADFTTLVAIGNSLTAGKSDNALYRSVQQYSFPALIAAAVGTPFVQPLFADPGLMDASNTPAGRLAIDEGDPDLSIAPVFWTSGKPANLNAGHPRAYNNLGIPGALTIDIRDAYDSGSITSPTNTIIDDILRPGAVLPDSTTILGQALSLNPTFVTLWTGNNEILGGATMGLGTPLMPPSNFALLLAQIQDSLTSQGAQGVVANIPYVTDIPFFNTIPPFVIHPDTREPILNPGTGQVIPLIAQEGSGFLLGPNDKVLLTAQDSLATGMGIPDPVLIQFIMMETGADSATAAALLPTVFPNHGQPLPSHLTLIESEVNSLASAVDLYNVWVTSVSRDHGYPVVDINGLLNDIKANGIEVGGIEYTSDFVSGGLFGLDGVHPTATAYAILANEFIKVINAYYLANIPYVDIPVSNINVALVATQGSVPMPKPLAFRYDPSVQWESVVWTGY